ncbi:MAG: hypothetical protein ACWGPN_07380, partial [Gammaproteobacteria bacterium]
CTDKDGRIVAASEPTWIGRVKAPAAAWQTMPGAEPGDVVVVEPPQVNGGATVALRTVVPDAFGSGTLGYFYAVLVTPALDMSHEFAIGILDRDRDGRICPYGGDSILIDGLVRERISIRSIERISDEQAEFLKMEFGLTESSEDQVIVTPIEEDQVIVTPIE